MYGWIDPFYVAAQAALEPGHVWLGHPLRLPARQALKIDRVNPKDDAKLDFTLAEATRDALVHPPVHSLGLGVGEGAVLARATLDQPVVLLGGTAAEQLGSGATAIVVPILAAAGLDEPTRRRISAYGYANAFYLPV